MAAPLALPVPPVPPAPLGPRVLPASPSPPDPPVPPAVLPAALACPPPAPPVPEVAEPAAVAGPPPPAVPNDPGEARAPDAVACDEADASCGEPEPGDIAPDPPGLKPSAGDPDRRALTAGSVPPAAPASCDCDCWLRMTSSNGWGTCAGPSGSATTPYARADPERPSRLPDPWRACTPPNAPGNPLPEPAPGAGTAGTAGSGIMIRHPAWPSRPARAARSSRSGYTAGCRRTSPQPPCRRCTLPVPAAPNRRPRSGST